MNPSSRQVIRALERVGFVRVSQRGSHVKLRRRTSESDTTVIVPLHEELAPGTLASILRQAGMNRDELVRLMK